MRSKRVASFILLLFVALQNVDQSQASLRGGMDENSMSGFSPRIINGEESESDRYPYFTLLLGSGMCGGVLIGPSLVLSAAHCYRVATQARIGVYDRRALGDAENIPISQISVHPSYRSSAFRYDAMILKLREPSRMKYVQINSDPGFPRDGDYLTVIGFGDTAIGSQTRLPNTLQETELDYVENDICSDMHGGRIDEDMLCAYRDETDSCFGDSGGPIFFKGSNADDDILVGTVSWGRDCAAEGYPGVYARTSFFYDWIVDTSCRLSPEDAPFNCGGVTNGQTAQSFPSSEPTSNPSSAPSTEPSIEPSIEDEQPDTVHFVAWSPNTPLKHCEGDCDDDNDCEGRLVCYEKSGTTVPGCAGERQRTIADFCVYPEDIPP